MLAPTLFINERLWLEAFRSGTDFLASCFGFDLKYRRNLAVAQAASAEVTRRMTLQSQIAGCRKSRSDRWNHAHFLRWIEFHAAAFDVVYGKLTDNISVAAARLFVRNFHYVEYLLAKRNRIRMEDWGRSHRGKLCLLIKSNDRYFSTIRRFHRLHRKDCRAFMDELDIAFALVAIAESDD